MNETESTRPLPSAPPPLPSLSAVFATRFLRVRQEVTERANRLMGVGKLRRGKIFLGFKAATRCRIGTCWCRGAGHGPVWLWGYESHDGRWRTSYLGKDLKPWHLEHLSPAQRQALPQVKQLLRRLKAEEARAKEALRAFRGLEAWEARLKARGSAAGGET